MDVGDKNQVKEAKITEKMIRDQELADLEEILSYAYCRRFIWRMLTWSGVYQLSFSRDHPELTNFKEGMRNIGLTLRAECIEANPEAYIMMYQEAQKQESKEKEGS